jgi:hypothetical protein
MPKMFWYIIISSSSNNNPVNERRKDDQKKEIAMPAYPKTRSDEHTCCISVQKPLVAGIGFSMKCKMGRAMDIKVTSKWLLLILECYLVDETQVALLKKTRVFIHRSVK